MSEDVLTQLVRDILSDGDQVSMLVDSLNAELTTDGAITDVALEAIPQLNEPINTMTGIFLKSVYFLNPNLTKCAIVGFVKNRGDELGVVISGGKEVVFFSYDAYKQITARSNDVTMTLECKTKKKKNQLLINLNGGGDVRVGMAYGQLYVYLYDGEHKTSLTTLEWSQFTNSIPLMNTAFRDLCMNEVLIKDFIRLQQSSAEEVEYVKSELPYPVANRLADEIDYFKRWPNGNSLGLLNGQVRTIQ